MIKNMPGFLNPRGKNILLVIIFSLSISIRFTLSLVNRDANDDHVEVINRILDKREIPVKEDCWECSQPKFYYIMNAILITNLKIDVADRIVAAQMFNFVLSIFILIFAWRFIRSQKFSDGIKILSFCLVAFNPCLTGINVQATNDTLGILAGTMTIFFADRFFRGWETRDFIRMSASVILACITKGSGLSLVLGLFMVYGMYMIMLKGEEKKFITGSFVIFTLACIAIVPFAGGYYNNYKKYHDPFINNIAQKDPAPDFFKQTYVARPGITSIVHGYFTFRIVDMLEHPHILIDKYVYPLHRTSLWSQLYGRTFFLHFDPHPVTWANTNPKVLRAGRILLILGLVPLALFAVGFCRSIYHFGSAVCRRNSTYLKQNFEWAHLAFVVASILFIVKYTYDYRDFATMKPIFVFPVFLSLTALFMSGMARIKSMRLKKIAAAAIILQSILSVYDIYFLIDQLKK